MAASVARVSTYTHPPVVEPALFELFGQHVEASEGDGDGVLLGGVIDLQLRLGVRQRRPRPGGTRQSESAGDPRGTGQLESAGESEGHWAVGVS